MFSAWANISFTIQDASDHCGWRGMVAVVPWKWRVYNKRLSSARMMCRWKDGNRHVLGDESRRIRHETARYY